jgi:hypothetical protein
MQLQVQVFEGRPGNQVAFFVVESGRDAVHGQNPQKLNQTTSEIGCLGTRN